MNEGKRGEHRSPRGIHDALLTGHFLMVLGRSWQYGQHCLHCRDSGAGRPDTNRGEVEMSLAPNFRAKQQMLIRRPDRVVELRARTHQPRPAALPVGPRPEGDQLTGSLNHEGSREDRVSREVLRVHPMLRTEIDLPDNGRALNLGDAGDLPHLGHGKEGGFEVDQGAAQVSSGAGIRYVGLLEGAHEVGASHQGYGSYGAQRPVDSSARSHSAA